MPSDTDRPSFQCVHFASDDEFAGVRDHAASRGGAVFELDATGVRDKDALLARVAAAMDFPEYFGGNWDAVADCLGDLSWREAPAYVLCVHGANELFAYAFEPAGEFISVWQSAAERWAGEGVPFHLVFVRSSTG